MRSGSGRTNWRAAEREFWLLAQSTARDAAQGPTGDGQIGPVRPVAWLRSTSDFCSDAAETVGYFLEQGVTVKVISGDNPVTVGAIAAQAGIPLADRPFDARDPPEDQEQLAEVLETHGVFGRVTPAQKRAMVGALKSKGHTVAMTGDGVNDVLALKDADLGIAMGSGAGATRAVAQLVLLDSSSPCYRASWPRAAECSATSNASVSRSSPNRSTPALLSLITVILTFDVDLQGRVHLPSAPLNRHHVAHHRDTCVLPRVDAEHSAFQTRFLHTSAALLGPGGRHLRVASFTTYLLVLTEGTPVEDARTAAAITLFIIAWTVLVLVARPLNPLRIAIVVVMGLGFVTVLGVPAISQFFALRLSTGGDGLTAIGVGIAGSVLLLVVRRFIETRVASDPKPEVESTGSGYLKSNW